MAEQENEKQSDKFANQAEAESSSLVGEFLAFLKNNGKWWLMPVIIVLLAVGVLIILGGTAVAPFIYTLF